jgi:quercetin dioxygenase-like cupin family protein
METLLKKTFSVPDESKRPGEKLTLDTVHAAGIKITKVTADPGWRWSKHLKLVKKTDTCETHHLLYMLSGVLASKMEGGKEETFTAGDIGVIPPGHDGWTVGDEPAVWIELPHQSP